MANLNTLSKNVFDALMASGEIDAALHATYDSPGLKDLIVVLRDGGGVLANAERIGKVWIEPNHEKTTAASVKRQLAEVFAAKQLTARDFWKNSITVFDRV